VWYWWCCLVMVCFGVRYVVLTFGLNEPTLKSEERRGLGGGLMFVYFVLVGLLPLL
jgi:uncharacterized membrane protein YhaH (DUF805 family)